VKLRTLIELAKVVIPITDVLSKLPKAVLPPTLSPLPNRVKLLTDIELPKLEKSRTLSEQPNRAKLRNDVAEPR
jgi:hypothetical protein